MTELVKSKKLLDAIFIISPLGIQLKNEDKVPSETAFETLLFYLAHKQDELRWKIASACNLYNRYHRAHAYEKAANILGLTKETIEQWAYIERNVPLEIRRSEKSIWFHRLVAKLDPDVQSEYLSYCIEQDMSYSIFEKWLIKQQNAKVPPIAYRSDRLFELEQENYRLVTENSDLKTELTKVKTSQLSDDKPDDYGLIVSNIIKTLQALAEVYPQGLQQIRAYLEAM